MTATNALAPAHTSGGKAHFEVLDGLRGTAALLVVLFHIQGIAAGFAHDKLILPHAYLAVDFFFALSGFVIGYAYDDRWTHLSTRRFLMLRLVRLHPMLVLGAVLGLASYLLDPFAGNAQSTPLAIVLAAFALALLVLPGPMLANRWEDTHPLNGPSWTLLQEYLANIAYAWVLRRLSVRALAWLAVAGLLGLLAAALEAGSLDVGYGWNNLWGAPARLVYPFVSGLLIYRLRQRLPAFRLGIVPLSALVALTFALPSLPALGALKLDALYDFLCVAVVFPALLVWGIGSEKPGWRSRLCRGLGRISYPIYITHFPFAYLFLNLALVKKAPPSVLLPAGLGLFAFTVLFAWAASRWLDEPLRAWLGRRLRR